MISTIIIIIMRQLTKPCKASSNITFVITLGLGNNLIHCKQCNIIVLHRMILVCQYYHNGKMLDILLLIGMVLSIGETSTKKLQIIIVLLPNSVYSGLQNSCHECGLRRENGFGQPKHFRVELALPPPPPPPPQSLDRTLIGNHTTESYNICS